MLEKIATCLWVIPGRQETWKSIGIIPAAWTRAAPRQHPPHAGRAGASPALVTPPWHKGTPPTDKSPGKLPALRTVSIIGAQRDSWQEGEGGCGSRQSGGTAKGLAAGTQSTAHGAAGGPG